MNRTNLVVTLVAILLVTTVAADAAAQEADLSVGASRSNFVDSTIGLTATVENRGPDDIFDLEVSLAFDDSLVTLTEMEEGCSGSSVGAACSFASLDQPVLSSGESRILDFVFSGSAAGATATITANSTATDPNDANDEASVSLEEIEEADLGVAASGIIDGPRRTIVFEVSNEGPDDATVVSGSGTVTVNFDEPQTTEGVAAMTGMAASGSSVCGRQVPELSEPTSRVTIPINCSFVDLPAGDSTNAEFWFEGASNALYRIRVSSSRADPGSANNQLDGDFLNTPSEDITSPTEEGCCSVAATRRTPGNLVAVMLLLAVALVRRRH